MKDQSSKARTTHPASFRDPSGFVFREEGVLYRQVNHSYAAAYDLLMSSGLYERLVAEHLLIPHEAVSGKKLPKEAHVWLQPETVPFVSYPYEWSFSQLQDAALTTLQIQKLALEYGMSLKDASAFNIQFWQGRPVLIDTLSFEPYAEGRPWVAYRQFCQHFLAPLALMNYVDLRANALCRSFIDGVPLDMAQAMLPRRTRLKPALLAHIHLHAGSQRKYANRPSGKERAANMSRFALRALIENLVQAAKGLRPKGGSTEWGAYYEGTNYTEKGMQAKEKAVQDLLEKAKPKTVWDLGANDGRFSRLASNQGIPTVAFDIDPVAVEKNYRQVRRGHEGNILPLVMDLTNPSPDLGWAHTERDSLASRGPADAILALALIHHLAISNNVPLARVAEYFSQLGRWLIIEFVPKEDSQVKRLLRTREDIFPTYDEAGFEAAFTQYYQLQEKIRLADGVRTLYLLKAKA